MSLYVIDIEADGPIPGDYSMLSFGAVRVDDELKTTYFSDMIYPISQKFDPSAIEAIGINRDDYVYGGRDPQVVMVEFNKWVLETSVKGRPIFLSDNNGFDWMFYCWYTWHFTNSNPFGYSSRRIGDIYCGLVKNMRAPWKHLRKTKHTHDHSNRLALEAPA